MSSTSSNPTPATPAPSSAQVTASNIESILNSAASIAAGLAPAIAPYVILGQAAEAAIPGLITAIQGLISGTAPTAADVAALRAQIQSLGNPAAL